MRLGDIYSGIGYFPLDLFFFDAVVLQHLNEKETQQDSFDEGIQAVI